MSRSCVLLACFTFLLFGSIFVHASPTEIPNPEKWTAENLEGWKLYVSTRFNQQNQQGSDQAAVRRARELLQTQLQEVKAVVPPAALEKLQQVSLYFSPEYPGISPRAEYHPGQGWLRDNGRDPVMAKGIEFTNIAIFDAETRRMPNFALHELAHAYHDQVHGFDHPQIRAAYERAKAGGKYDRVQRQDSEGNLAWDKAYAITNASEYFAETSEAFFSRNDFYPFTRDELKTHDPQMDQLLEKLWKLDAP